MENESTPQEIAEWTKKDKDYNNQINLIEFYWFNEKWRFEKIEKNPLEDLLFYFGIDKYETDENFLKRRKRIILYNPNFAKKALSIAQEIVDPEYKELFNE